MHQLVLLTALTATSGIFGHKSCGTSKCGRPAMMRHHTYAAPVSTCSTGSCYSAPMTHHAAAPTMQYAAPQAAAAAPAMAPASHYVQSYYYTPASPCANGQCYRR